MDAHFTNLCEFENGARIFRVLPKPYADTPVSPLLCGNFIEVGFGYQVESMWTEMLFNRSFEHAYPIARGTHDWFGGDQGLGSDWTREEWYNSSYEHNRWYAFPGKDMPQSITPDATYLTPLTPGYSVVLSQVEGGVHGHTCLKAVNADDRMAGVAQDGKYLRKGESYVFSGYFQLLDGPSEGAELRMYDTAGLEDAVPLVTVPLAALTREGAWQTLRFTVQEFEGFATFALLLPGGCTALMDAFSLMPECSAGGWRPDVVKALCALKPSVMRFPGGNFGSLHCWKDAIGPRNERRPEPSIMWGDLNYNDVGTDEFLDLCERVGCEPLLLVNMYHPLKEYHFMAVPRENSVWAQNGMQRHGGHVTHVLNQEEGIEIARQWVEYCNGDIFTPMGALRAKNGHPAPYHVKYWEMDNETWRWFTKEEYAAYVRKYAEAMRSVDPEIQIGICSYHVFSDEIEDILALCGDVVNFIADRMCEPFNIKRKIGIVQRYNQTHEHQIYYADTEALQNRPLTLAPYTKAFYAARQIDFCQSRRTWIYALTMAGNLLHYERYGSLARFMCFNNLCNTSGQSCIEVSKQETILSASGILMAAMARTQAAWPLEIEGYEADSLKSVEVQVSWNKDRTRLVINLVNKCEYPAAVTLDLNALGMAFTSSQCLCLWAEDGAAQETIRSHGSVHEEVSYHPAPASTPVTYQVKPFSFSEIVLS